LDQSETKASYTNLDNLLSLVDGASGSAAVPSEVDDRFETTFHLVLEPLYLGFMPKTAGPAILYILVFAGGAASCVPTFISMLEKSHRNVSLKDKVE